MKIKCQKCSYEFDSNEEMAEHLEVSIEITKNSEPIKCKSPYYLFFNVFVLDGAFRNV